MKTTFALALAGGFLGLWIWYSQAVTAMPPAATPAAAVPPGGKPITAKPPSKPITIKPPGGPITTKPPSGKRDRGDFNWQGVVEGILRGSERPGYEPPRYPGRPKYPGGIRIVPPTYEEPIEPRPTVTPAPPTVAPKPNVVVVKPPRQLPPLTGRLWEVSVREARCYASALQGMAEQALTDAGEACVQEGVNMKAVGPQIDQLRQMLGRGAPWREMEPVMKALFETNHGTFSANVRGRFQHVLRFLLVRDGFAIVGNSAPRGRGAAIALTGIPKGLVWVLFDPTFPAGMGLLVNDFIVVCGTGGAGELMLVRTSVADGLGLPVGPGEPVPDISPKEAQAPGDSIVLRCQEEAGSAVNYVLNSTYSFSMQPGNSQKLARDRQWVIEFDRGGGRGLARYTLDKGSFEFRIVEGQWGLFKMNYEVVIDNREGTEDFKYVTDNKIVTVKPGETKTHTGESPVVVEFDRGAGPDEPARKNLNKSGTYKVAVDVNTNTWDLFAMNGAKPEKGGAATGSD